MPILECSKRDLSVKAKALRKKEIAPAVIYGKNLKESVLIQVPNIDLVKLLKGSTLGSLVEVDVDGTVYSTMLKKVDYTPLSTTVQHVDFQVVTKGEKIKTSAPIHFINQDSVSSEGLLQERISEIEYEVLPMNIVDYFEVDLSKLELGEDIKLQDLDIYKDENLNFITPGDTSLVRLSIVNNATSDDEEAVEVASVEEVEED